jgi:hypothetical protein
MDVGVTGDYHASAAAHVKHQAAGADWYRQPMAVSGRPTHLHRSVASSGNKL